MVWWGAGVLFPPPHVANIRDLGALYKGACDTLLAGTLQAYL